MRLEIEPNVASLDFSQDHATAVSTPRSDADFEQNLKLAIAAAQSGDRDQARILLFKVTETEPQSVDAWLWLASISEYPEELLGFLVKVLEIDPANQRARQWEKSTRSLLAKTFVQRGLSARTDGQIEFAADCFDDALEYDLSCSSAWFWKSAVSESVEEKELCLARVLDLDPSHEDAQQAMRQINESRCATKLNAARSAAFAGDMVAAALVVDNILSTEPQNVDAWKLRSHLTASLTEKLESYRRILEFDPEDVFARVGYEYLANEQASAADASDQDRDPAELRDVTVDDNADEVSAQPLSFFALPDEQILDLDAAPNGSVEFASDESPDACDINILEDRQEHDLGPVDSDTDEALEFSLGAMEFRPAYEDSILLEDHSEAFSSNVEETNEGEWQQDPIPASSEPAEPVSEIDELYSSSYTADSSDIGEIEAADPNNSLNNLEQPFSEFTPCSFCGGDNEPQAFLCSSCRAVLSLTDIDSLFHGTQADRETVQDAVTRMEAEWNLREFSESELKTLGLGHFNLNNFEQGVAYFHEASRLNPNDVIFAGQVNAFAIRLDELQRQEENRECLPKGKTILVVDDSATVRKLISSKLEKSGHIVITAVDGVEAMEIIETTVPDLVLLDIAMPRLDGYSVCKLIRANDSVKDVPVVMISGKDGFFDKVRGRMAGTTGYITKPFGPETLMRALDTYLIPDESAG